MSSHGWLKGIRRLFTGNQAPMIFIFQRISRSLLRIRTAALLLAKKVEKYFERFLPGGRIASEGKMTPKPMQEGQRL
jgi:hypothetical protein